MNNSNEVYDVLGIDISKAKFDVALMQGNAKIKSKVFANNPEGFAELQAWLNTQGATNLHSCMEATSTYDNGLARFLVEAGVNPSRPKAFGKSELSRIKTDHADAKVIARFCAALKPAPWTPPALEIEQLQALVHRLDSLTAMQQQEQNLLAKADPILVEAIIAHIDFLKEQIEMTKKLIRQHFDQHPHLKSQRDLLTSIPGIAELTATLLLAEIRDISAFDTADQLAAFAELTPCESSSGSSIHGKPRLSKIGNSRLRKALFMPAIVARCYNSPIAIFCDRLTAKGKSKMSVIGAVMHKLLRQVFGVLKSQRSFDPNFVQIPS